MTIAVHFVGTCTGDPTMRYTEDGTPVTSVNMAVNDKGKDGERVTWVKCTLWRKPAEVANEYWKKGTHIEVKDGEIVVDPKTGNPRIWKGQDGEARCSLEVTVNRWGFAGKKAEE